jgi:hypothetical protein
MLKYLLVAVMMFASFVANASLVNFSGTLDNDRYDYATFNFTVGQNSTVNIWSDSSLDVSSPGSNWNFDTMIALYTSIGGLLGWSDDYDSFGDSPNAGSWHSGMSFLDSSLKFDNLLAGNYTVAVLPFSGNSIFDLVTGKNLQNSFVDPLGSGSHSSHIFLNARDYNLNLEITPNSNNVPEPGDAVLILLGLLGFAFAKSNRKQYSFARA